MPNSSLIEERRSIPSSDRAPRCNHFTTCSWRPSSPILPSLTFSTSDEVLGTHRKHPPNSARYSFSAGFRRPKPRSRRIRNACRCVYRKLDSAIMVMEATQEAPRCDDAKALDRAMERGIFVQRAMNSPFIVIVHRALKRPAQVCFTQHNDVVDALAADRADQPFGKAVLPR